MINKVEICGVDTSKLPLLSTEEKNEFTNATDKTAYKKSLYTI